ncbi:MAG: hypothetical protein E6017_01220 [Kluyvera cryocrescens]|nr:hypothetical protein [Kluyvera cryocrescens]
MNINLIEMEGLLRGKCLPGDLLVGETLAEYLVRQFAKLNEQLTESRREFTAANATIHNLELQLADAEARGVDKFATEIGSVHKQLRPGSNHAHALKSVVFRAVEFAAQLRQGAEHE